MNRIKHFLVPAIAASVLLAACGSSSSTSSSTSSNPASTPGTAAAVVKTASNSTAGGTILVNASGMTLYHLTGEQNGKWICSSSACVGTWHPVTVPSSAAATGRVGSLSAVKRPDGTLQVAFKGYPLYTFSGDSNPGDAKGQGLKDVGTWTVVKTTGAAGTGTSSTGSYHSGY